MCLFYSYDIHKAENSIYFSWKHHLAMATTRFYFESAWVTVFYFESVTLYLTKMYGLGFPLVHFVCVMLGSWVPRLELIVRSRKGPVQPDSSWSEL